MKHRRFHDVVAEGRTTFTDEKTRVNCLLQRLPVPGSTVICDDATDNGADDENIFKSFMTFSKFSLVKLTSQW
jgi:hypothetical protein